MAIYELTSVMHVFGYGGKLLFFRFHTFLEVTTIFSNFNFCNVTIHVG
jgi:hypothetical protein